MLVNPCDLRCITHLGSVRLILHTRCEGWRYQSLVVLLVYRLILHFDQRRRGRRGICLRTLLQQEKKTKTCSWICLINSTPYRCCRISNVQTEIRHLRETQVMLQSFSLILTGSILGSDGLNTFIPFITAFGDELSLPVGTYQLVECEGFTSKKWQWHVNKNFFLRNLSDVELSVWTSSPGGPEAPPLSSASPVLAVVVDEGDELDWIRSKATFASSAWSSAGGGVNMVGFTSASSSTVTDGNVNNTIRWL